MIPARAIDLVERVNAKAGLALLAVDELGVGWAFERVRVEAEHRLGILERRTPLSSWATYEVEGSHTRRAGLLNVDSARDYYAQHPEPLKELRARHQLIKQREFSYFGTRAHPDSWHHDPIGNATYAPAVHWTKISEKSDADLKLVWEPSRFSWAIELAQLHAGDQSSSAQATFWELFEDWCDNNQPNTGVNWQCGQESSIRFMAVMFAIEAFDSDASLTDERKQLLAAFADVTARRVLAHWRYARSQKNNHIVSEAVGLLGVAGFFPELEIADRAWKVGDSLLREACEALVFPDGGTSQYSLNYHRVFLDNFIWARTLYDRTGRAVPAELDRALDRATAFLEALIDDESGLGPNFGHNDGARLLPVASAVMMDMRPTLAASRRVRGIDNKPDELASWFHQPETQGSNSARPRLHYPNAGITILKSGRSRAVIRGGEYLYRPAHSDQLHVDVWIDGMHVVADPGTWSYKPIGDEPDLALSQFHNGPIVDDREDMRRASRFLFLNWSRVTHDEVDPDGRVWQGTRTSPATGMIVTRRVELTDTSCTITDQIDLTTPGQVRTHWVLASTSSDADVVLSATAEDGGLPVARGAGTTILCSSYRTSVITDWVTIEASATRNNGTALTTEIGIYQTGASIGQERS